MKFNSGHKIILSVSLLSILALIIVVLVIIPTAKNIQTITNNTYELRVYMEKKYQESLRSRLTKKKIDQIKAESSDYDLHLFNKNDSLLLIQHLEKISKQANVNQVINSTNLDQIMPGSKLQISVTVSGKYSEVLEYINSIENVRYFFNVESVRIIPNSGGDGLNYSNATAYLTLGLYVSK